MSDESSSELGTHAIPLAGVDPDLPDDDLAPLLAHLAGARLIGLGEATHGDHESFQFRSRLVQALVRHRGLRAVLFEAGPVEVDPWDDYVTGATDARPTGRDLAFWWTEEVRDLLVWLRSWNAAHPDAPVRVGGTTPTRPGLVVALRRLDEAGIAAPAEWRRLVEEAPGRCGDPSWVESALAAWHATPPPPLDPADPRHRRIALLAGTFPQSLELWFGRVQPPEQWALQDRYISENALAQLERFGPGTTAALLAHNFHVWLEPWRAGGRLCERLGAAYQSVFATFGRGAYNAFAESRSGKWKPHPCPPPPPGSMEHLLDQLDLDCYALDPIGVPSLRQEQAVRNARMVAVDGADQFRVRCIPAQRFDLVVYFREAHPSRMANPTGVEEPTP
jgi:erythromycin esterase